MDLIPRSARLWSCCTAGVLAAALLLGCASPERHAERLAQRGGLRPVLLTANGFMLQGYVRLNSGDSTLVVFIDGDGTPWVADGQRPASNPTPRRPLALELAARTPDSALYIGRPCYFSLQRRGCNSRLWTFERYSSAVVLSLAIAIDAFCKAHGFRHVIVVGYSGGGALAVLLARGQPRVVGVVTVAGNLDVSAWTRWHGYLPLAGSRDPAEEPPLPKDVLQWHLVGDQDRNVPPTLAARYLQQAGSSQVWHYAAFDHRCCWVEQWPMIWDRIAAQLPVTP